MLVLMSCMNSAYMFSCRDVLCFSESIYIHGCGCRRYPQCLHHRAEARWKRVGRREDGSKVDRKSFTQVMSSNVVNITAGGYHTMLLKQDGTVWTTGWNERCQLGDGSQQTHLTTYRWSRVG